MIASTRLCRGGANRSLTVAVPSGLRPLSLVVATGIPARLLILALSVLSCRGASVDPPDAAASPQASAEPAPLANVSTAAGATTTSTAGADSGPPPEALRGDRALTADAPHETVRELGTKDPRGTDTK